MKRLILFSTGMMVVLMLVVVSVIPVKAAPPVKITTYVDFYETDTSMCAFPVTQHYYGSFKSTIWLDDNGNLIKEHDTYGQFRIDWYTSADKILNVHGQGPITTELPSPTELIYRINGPSLTVIVPGYGPVSFISTGLLYSRYEFIGSDWTLVEFKVAGLPGVVAADLQAICSYLAP